MWAIYGYLLVFLPFRPKFLMSVWIKNIVCLTCKQRILQPSNQHNTVPQRVSPEGLRMETKDAHCQTLRDCSHPQIQGTWRWLRMEISRILSPESWGAFQRNDFSEPRLLHLPIHRKVLNSLMVDIWVSLINRNLFDVLNTWSLLKKLYILGACLPLWSQVLSSASRSNNKFLKCTKC